MYKYITLYKLSGFLIVFIAVYFLYTTLFFSWSFDPLSLALTEQFLLDLWLRDSLGYMKICDFVSLETRRRLHLLLLSLVHDSWSDGNIAGFVIVKCSEMVRGIPVLSLQISSASNVNASLEGNELNSTIFRSVFWFFRVSVTQNENKICFCTRKTLKNLRMLPDSTG